MRNFRENFLSLEDSRESESSFTSIHSLKRLRMKKVCLTEMVRYRGYFTEFLGFSLKKNPKNLNIIDIFSAIICCLFSIFFFHMKHLNLMIDKYLNFARNRFSNVMICITLKFLKYNSLLYCVSKSIATNGSFSSSISYSTSVSRLFERGSGVMPSQNYKKIFFLLQIKINSN